MFKNLKAELVRAEISNDDIVKKLNISRQALANKKNGKTEWKLSEVDALQKMINEKLNTNYTISYLFDVKGN